MSAEQLYCLMRAQQLELERLRRRQACAPVQEDPEEDPDSMEDNDQPYFWNRRYL